MNTNLTQYLYMTLKTLRAIVIANVILAVIAIGMLIVASIMSTNANAKPIYNRDQIIVVEVDTGIDYDIPAIKAHVPEEYRILKNKNETGDPSNPYFGHGTHIAGLILDGVCKEVKLVPCVFYSHNKHLSEGYETTECFKFARSIKADIINYSAGGIGANFEEFSAVKELTEGGTRFIAAVGNDHKPLYVNPVFTEKAKQDRLVTIPPKGYESYYPASYDLPNITRVQSLDEQLGLALTSNYSMEYSNQNKLLLAGKTKEKPHVDGFDAEIGDSVESYYPGGQRGKMSGSSQAAAKVTNRILKQMCNELERN